MIFWERECHFSENFRLRCRRSALYCVAYAYLGYFEHIRILLVTFFTWCIRKLP